MEKLRLIVLVDLPLETRHERKVAREFREALFKDGFSLLQENVYTRISNGRTNADLHKQRLKGAKPEVGLVRLFVLTENQFQEASILTGTDNTQESEIGSTLDIFL